MGTGSGKKNCPPHELSAIGDDVTCVKCGLRGTDLVAQTEDEMSAMKRRAHECGDSTENDLKTLLRGATPAIHSVE